MPSAPWEIALRLGYVPSGIPNPGGYDVVK